MRLARKAFARAPQPSPARHATSNTNARQVHLVKPQYAALHNAINLFGTQLAHPFHSTLLSLYSRRPAQAALHHAQKEANGLTLIWHYGTSSS